LIQPWRNWYLSRQLICRHVQPDKIWKKAKCWWNYTSETIWV
jgi:hypothetical protein